MLNDLWPELSPPYLDFKFQLGVDGVHHFCPFHFPSTFVAQTHQLERRHLFNRFSVLQTSNTDCSFTTHASEEAQHLQRNWRWVADTRLSRPEWPALTWGQFCAEAGLDNSQDPSRPEQRCGTRITVYSLGACRRCKGSARSSDWAGLSRSDPTHSLPAWRGSGPCHRGYPPPSVLTAESQPTANSAWGKASLQLTRGTQL